MNVTTIAVQFAKRTAEQVTAKLPTSHADVLKVNATLDFSKLTEEEVLLWAQRGVVISLQSKMESGTLTVKDGDVIEVPKPGDRKRLSDSDKLRKMVAGILGKDVKDLTDEEFLSTLTKAMGK